MNEERVDKPDHYSWVYEACGIHPIQLIRLFDFDLGNVLKYVIRAGHKKEAGMDDKVKELEDLKKAKWYLIDKIGVLEHELATNGQYTGK